MPELRQTVFGMNRIVRLNRIVKKNKFFQGNKLVLGNKLVFMKHSTLKEKDIDLEILFKRFGELFDTPYYNDIDVVLAGDEAIKILKESLRTRFITRREFNQFMS